MSSYSDVLSTGITRYGIIAVVVTTVLTTLATILAVMRFMFRRKVGFGVDDYLLMAVLVFLMIQLVIQYMSELIPYSSLKTDVDFSERACFPSKNQLCSLPSLQCFSTSRNFRTDR